MRNMILQVRNFKHIFLLLLLCGAVGSAIAGTPCGTNLEYELDGTTLVLTSPNSASPATIDASAFKDRTDITAVVFPDNLTVINSEAFHGCTNLTSIVIPPVVTEIGEYAFDGCSLTDVFCRPFDAPTLGNVGLGTNNPTVCVPNLGSYNEAANHWKDYTPSFCSFLDEYDEQATTSSKITQYSAAALTDIDIFRTLRKAGCFNTLTLPFNVPNIATSPLAGAEVYEFVGATVVDNALQLDITLLAGSSLTAGTPYLIQWPNTGEVLNAMLFMGISWDVDQMADDAGAGQVTYHGFYGRTHIDDATNGTQHLNLFLGGNNTLYWPTDGDIASAKMLGFRAWFQVSTVASFAPVHRNMPASFRIVSTPTDMDQITNDQLPKTNKIIEDGHLIIIRNGEKYSIINGQKL